MGGKIVRSYNHLQGFSPSHSTEPVPGILPAVKISEARCLFHKTLEIIPLLSNADISAIHIVSHGSPGCLYLGNSQLSLDTLTRLAEFPTPATGGDG
ncbi:DUF4347 domain-containing protein [Moorena sp. SIO4A5]|uniref:DUF4347 domain-containing protein n=1 Tax=unclassified Moorena TaxID=2683338 RepID=UPI003434ECFD